AGGAIRGELPVGPRPTGLAWAPARGHLLAADVGDFRARLVEAATGRAVALAELPGRPRWCVYEPGRDRYLINIREPAVVAALAGGTLARVGTYAIPVPGPHGLDLDSANDRAFVACDGGAGVCLDLAPGAPSAPIPVAGEPDAIWFDPTRRRLYVAIGKPGQIDVVDTATLAVVERLPTEEGAHTTAFDPVRQQLYVFLPRSCRTAIYGYA